MGLFDIFKKEKFVYLKKFKFNQFPKILKCHTEYQKLGNYSYEVEELFEEGKCSKEENMQATHNAISYYRNEYARVVYEEFSGKGLKIKLWKTKKAVLFDNVFPSPFENLTEQQKSAVVGIVEIKYGWKLPSEYYEKN